MTDAISWYPHRPVVAAVVAVAAVAGAAASAGAGDPTYAAADFGATFPPGAQSFAVALNEDGDAVGEAWIGAARIPFVYTYEHGAVLLPLLDGYPNARALDVSERATDGTVLIAGVAAESFFLDQADRGAWWRYDVVANAVVDSGMIEPLPGFDRSSAVAVDNAGRLVGQSLVPSIQPMLFEVATRTTTPIDFPVAVATMNNVGQIAGGTYIGDLTGSYANVGFPAGSIGATITDLNDAGDVSAVAHMPFTDGSGFFVNGIARRVAGSWDLIEALSRFDGGYGLNGAGDVVGDLGISAAIRPVVFFDRTDALRLLNPLIDPQEQLTVSAARAINDAGQIAVGGIAAVLTPLGEMIIPGDVNGDADVDQADLCAFLVEPVDVDGDGDVDEDDELWLIDRLVSLGFVVDDCNGNGIPDACDILEGRSDDCDGNGVPDECDPDCDGNGTPDACEADCNGNGTPDPCDILKGVSEDCNGNGVPDECDGSETVVAGIVYDPPAPLFEGVPFIDSVLLADVGIIEDVDVTLDLDYRIGTVTVLLHHAGATAVLVDQPGQPAHADGFTNLGYRIVLDDEGAGPSIQTVGASCCEFEPVTSPPSYRPAESLDVFDGLPREGTWELEFMGGLPQHFDPKMLSWSVSVTDVAVDPGTCDCPADLDGSEAVDLGDLLELLAAWGVCGDCPADLDADGTVGVSDLLELLEAWGPCP